MRRVVLFIGFALGACAPDVRSGYVGTWDGRDTVTVSGQMTAPSPTSLITSVAIQLLGTDQISMDAFECGTLTATVQSAADFTLDTPASCNVNDSNGCSYQFTYQSGGGTRAGTTLAFSASGTGSWTCPSVGNDSGTFTEAATLSQSG